MVTEKDLDNLRHTLGVSIGRKKSSHGNRNYFAAGKGEQTESMQRLLSEGLVVKGREDENLTYYHATKEGCEKIGLHKAAINRALNQ
jgi:hypothetical protein